MKTMYLGIDVGGTKIKTVVMDAEGAVLEQNEMSTEDSIDNPEIWKTRIIDLINTKTAELVNGDKSILLCGLSAPGLADSANNKIIHMPGRLNGLENFDWSHELGRKIIFINDGHSSCIAEYEAFYRGKEVKNMLMLTLGTGVGGGIIINGEIYQGEIQRAGHFGHTLVDHDGRPTITNMVGSLEYAVGDFSVAERTHKRYTSVKDLVAAYEHGDTLATFWWLSSVHKLAAALASLTNSFSPEVIVLGGGISAGAGEALLKPVKEFMAMYEWQPGGYQVTINQAQFGGYAGAIGAAFFAKKTINGGN